MIPEINPKEVEGEESSTLVNTIEELNSKSNEIVKNDISEINHKTVRDSLDEYWGGKQMSEITSKIIRIASVAGIAGTLGASLAGCKSTPDIDEKLSASNTVPITEPYKSEQEQVSPENIVSYEENKEIVYKDINLEDIETWKELSPEKVEKTSKIIQTTENTEIILLPVQSDYFYNQKKDPTIWKLPSGSNLEVKGIYYFDGEDGNIARFGILPNIMGAKSIPIVFLDNGHMVGENYVIDGKNYEEPKSSEILSNFSYVAGEDEIYPNKIANVLTAMKGIVEKQERDGKFVKGQEYSYIDLIGLKNFGNFREGFTSSRAVVRGGGVCAGATLLSNSLYELALEENIPWNSVVKERWTHPSMYPLGPFSVNDFLTDATVQLSSEVGGDRYDFRWIQPEDAFIKINISMIPNNLNVSDTEPSGIGGKSDMQLILNLSFTETDPGNQSDKIEEFIAAYDEYRRSGHLEISPLLSQGEYIKDIGWDNPTYQVLMEYIYPEEKIEYFKEEMESEEYLSNIKELQDIVNNLPSSFSGNLGSYFKNTSWYEELPNKESIEGALGIINSTNVPGQPLQCVGFVILLSGLKYEGLNIQNVGGSSRFFGIGSSPSRTATELLPYKLINDKYATVASTGYGGIALGSENMSIGDYEVGDLFVRADVGNSNIRVLENKENITFQTGHIGAIIGKKIVDGEVVLLVADANRKNDGQIKIFEVTGDNFYKIFGDPGVKKFIIRAASN